MSSTVEHPIPPVFDARSKLLILGSFPSVKSRAEGFFYGHPQNRFWRVLSTICHDTLPKTVEEKKRFLLAHGIALWDVIDRCEIEGSADSTIQNVVANDLGVIFNTADIRQIFINGKTAEKYYNRYLLPCTGREALCLPSTSSANAAWSFERLCEAWAVIGAFINSDSK